LNLKHLNDNELLSQTKMLTQKERHLLTQVLHHLREVDKRKLFSELGYQSLFEYAVKELRYSEGQAGRRIQAMRLLKELPELESKIAEGKLSLSNISQAQSYFREAQKDLSRISIKNTTIDRGRPCVSGITKSAVRIDTKSKMKILESLENKSAREGQRILLKMQPQTSLPKERQRLISESHTEVTFVIDQDLQKKINELRAFLGIKGANMSMAQLMDYMLCVCLHDIKIKKFGKKRALSAQTTYPINHSSQRNFRKLGIEERSIAA
jgi:hypothetical protein